MQLFQFAVHRPGCVKLPVVQAVGGNIAISGVEAEAKIGRVGGRKMLIQAQHGRVFMIQLPSGAGELIDIRGVGCQSCRWIGGDDRRQLRIGRDHLSGESRAGDEARERLAITLAQSFIGEEEEAAVADDPAAEIAAELVEAKRKPGGKDGIAGIEDVVAQEFEQAAMQGVRAGLRGDINLAAGGASVFGGKEHRVDVEFLDGVSRNRKPDESSAAPD